ncbi:hypothetical protein VE03_07904 [Pseudogymnoascus sp. 23342-1-I1]|nr:hypothetical protein VE03_07904 [Pseudogymnoascus sp. 23342-1-I1]
MTSPESSGSQPGSIDVLRWTAKDLNHALEAGHYTSVDIVQAYLSQIEKHNREGAKLNTVIVTTPLDVLLAKARDLDEERKNGLRRSPLHGIPILVKDNMVTGPELGMDTTCGSTALRGVKTLKNADVVDILEKAGLLIVGKANLSTSAGSSSGSAVGVAAGFVPIAIGSETDGSITQPAGRQGLYGLKLTIGSVSIDGVLGMSPFSDTVGPIGKTAEDVAVLAGIMQARDFSKDLVKSWEGFKVAFVKQTEWVSGSCFYVEKLAEKQERERLAAMDHIQFLGGKVVRDVHLAPYSSFTRDGKDGLEAIWQRDYAPSLEGFLRYFVEPPIKCMKDLVQFNIDHKDVELPSDQPSQHLLEEALHTPISPEEYAETSDFVRATAKGAFESIFKEHDVDLVISMLQCRVGTMSAASGYPHGTVPLGYADNYNGRGYGLSIIARDGEEGKIIRFMSAWDASHPDLRHVPAQLVEAEEISSSI